MTNEKHSLVPGAFLVLKQDDKILLLQRANTGHGDGKYSFVAGHVEKGETFTDAIIREAVEEAGILVTPDNLQVCHVQHKKSDNGGERIFTYFLATEWAGEIENKEPEKCSDLAWFPLDKLPENMVECVRFAIENIQKNIFYSEFGW